MALQLNCFFPPLKMTKLPCVRVMASFMLTCAALTPLDKGTLCPGSKLLLPGFESLGRCRHPCLEGGLLRKTLVCGEEQDGLGGSQTGSERCKNQVTGVLCCSPFEASPPPS